MTQNEANVGTVVETLREFSRVPQGTRGVIDEAYEGGVMVAWHLRDHPLPVGYHKYTGAPAVSTGITRDGFSYGELEYLKLVGHVLPPLTQEDLKNMRCPCGKPECGDIFLKSMCHPKFGTMAIYDQHTGVLHIRCAKCEKPITRVLVAEHL